jgi:hypothetical protein
MNAGDFSAAVFGKHLPLKTSATFVASFFCANGETPPRVRLATPHGLENLVAIAIRKHIVDRAAYQVLAAMAKVHEKRFVAKQEFSFCVQERP